MASGFLSQSFALCDVAIAAHNRSLLEADAKKNARSNDPLISIVFAVATCESFITELARFAENAAKRPHPSIPDEPGEIQSFVNLYKEFEETKARLTSRFILAYQILSGVPADKGDLPYQDFALLVDVRNALIHIKLDELLSESVDNSITMRYPKVISKLHGKCKMAPLPVANTLTSWTQLISTPSVAEWTIRTAVTTIIWIINAIPKKKLRTQMELFYSPKFEPLTRC